MKQRKERRREPRARIARPVYVETADPNDKHFEEVRMTRDLSPLGLLFRDGKELVLAGNAAECHSCVGLF